MDEKEYKKWIRRIDVLMRKKEKLRLYDLSLGVYQDDYKTSQRYTVYSYNDSAERKREEIDEMINSILKMLKKEGYDTDKIMEKYDTKKTNKGEVEKN